MFWGVGTFRLQLLDGIDLVRRVQPLGLFLYYLLSMFMAS